MSAATFVHDLQPDDLPPPVIAILKRSLLDTIGVAAVGSASDIAKAVGAYASDLWRPGASGVSARRLFSNDKLSPAGAAMVNAFMIDAIDAHDGHSPVKGHAGSAVFPALLSFWAICRAESRHLDARQFVTAMAVGYEIAYRSGLTLHATTGDYHTSGAWTAVGVAAMGARLLGLTADQTRHALGIAEYHGPRSQMMRCIDYPSMVRDGVGWGAPVGVEAVLLARQGFTGAPAITVEDNAAHEHWRDLGARWEIENTHYKRYPVCRWAHPAIDAAAGLMRKYGLCAADIVSVKINTFHNAIRLAGHAPRTLDELAYGIAYPTAIMIVRGGIGPDELRANVLEDPEIGRIAAATKLVESEHYNRISVGVRWADVTLTLTDGRVLQSEPCKPKGDPDDPLGEEEMSAKFHRFADPVLGRAKADAIENEIGGLSGDSRAPDRLIELLFQANGN